MGKVICDGVNKNCDVGYGVHRFVIEIRGRGQGEKSLCSSCRTTMETAGYTLTQLVDVPEARVVKTKAVRSASSPSAWQSWIDGE